MLVRSSFPVLDESLCALQGYGAAFGANLVASAAIVNPINGAIFGAGLATAEKMITLCGGSALLPGPEIWAGPFPLGPKNIARYSIAALIVTQAMEFGGLIAAAPVAVTAAGGLGVLVLVISAIAKVLFGAVQSFKSPEEQAKEIFNSNTKVNRIVSFPHEGKQYRVRCAHDPSVTGVSIGAAGTSARYIIASEPQTPEAVMKQVKALLPEDAKGLYYTQGKGMGGISDFDLLAMV